MPKLDDIEENLSEKELFFKWLVEERVSFKDLSELYVFYLEQQNKDYKTETSRYVNLLAQYLQYGDLPKKAEWIRDKSIGTLYAYEKFKGAPIYDLWKEIIENNNINTDLKTLSYEVYKTKED